MTENTVTETPAVDAATATDTAEAERAAKVAAVRAALDDFGVMALTRLESQIVDRNSNVKALNTVDGDYITKVTAYREALVNGEDVAGLLSVQQQISDAEEALAVLLESRDSALDAHVKSETEASDADPVALKETVKSLDKTIREGTTYAKGIYGDDFVLLLPEQTPVKGSRKSSTNGGGSGQRRLRGYDVKVDGVLATTPDNNGVQKSSFSAAAKVLGHKEVGPVRDAFLNKYGDDAEKHGGEMTVLVADSDGTDHTLTITKQA